MERERLMLYAITIGLLVTTATIYFGIMLVIAHFIIKHW